MNRFTANDGEYNFLLLLFSKQVKDLINIAYFPGFEDKERLMEIFLRPQDELEYKISRKLLFICFNMNNAQEYIYNERSFSPFDTMFYKYVISYLVMLYGYSQKPEVEETFTKEFDLFNKQELDKFNEESSIIQADIGISNENLLYNLGVSSGEEYYKICTEANLLQIFYGEEALDKLKKHWLVNPSMSDDDPVANELAANILISSLESLAYREYLVVEGKQDEIVQKEKERLLEFLNYFDSYVCNIKKRKFGD